MAATECIGEGTPFIVLAWWSYVLFSFHSSEETWNKMFYLIFKLTAQKYDICDILLNIQQSIILCIYDLLHNMK